MGMAMVNYVILEWPIFLPPTTLNMIFSVTFYLELHNATSIYCISCILPTDVRLVVWTLYNNNNFTYIMDVKKLYINNKKGYSIVWIQIVSDTTYHTSCRLMPPLHLTLANPKSWFQKHSLHTMDIISCWAWLANDMASFKSGGFQVSSTDPPIGT